MAGKPNWIERLMVRWNLKSGRQVIVVIIVFACTGLTSVGLKKPIMHWLSGSHHPTITANIVYYTFLLLPIYNLLLLGYGFLFGQFQFFWDFEKRFFGRIISKFKRN